MIALKFPTGLRIDAAELEDGNWRLSYEEYFKPKDLKAFKNSFTLMKEVSKKLEDFKVALDEDDYCIRVILEAPRGVVFSFMCGEFFSLSNIATMTLGDLFIRACVGVMTFKEEK